MDTEEELLLQKIMQEQSKSVWGKEYLVRGATVTCDQSFNPEQTTDVKIMPDHGKFVLGKPVLSSYDTTANNIYGFGRCINKEICKPLLSEQWININENQTVFDEHAMTYAGLPTTSSYLICTRYGTGKVSVVDSGQPSDKKVDIPDAREVKEDVEIDITNTNLWIKFTPSERGNYNINLQYKFVPSGVSIYEAVSKRKMKLLSSVDHFDFRSFNDSSMPTYNKRIEHWLDKGKTYFITSDDAELYDYQTLNIIISGNLDKKYCDSNNVGGTWYKMGNIRNPESFGYFIFQKTFLSVEAATALYASLYDPESDKGQYNSSRDYWVSKGRSAFIAFITFYFGEFFLPEKLSKGAAAAASYLFTETAGDVLPSSLTELEATNIYEKGKFKLIETHGQTMSIATCGIEMVFQSSTTVPKDYSLSSGGGTGGQNTVMRTTMESWEDNTIKGIKYFRGLINEKEECLLRNLF